jgi:hypothetical protein
MINEITLFSGKTITHNRTVKYPCSGRCQAKKIKKAGVFFDRLNT